MRKAITVAIILAAVLALILPTPASVESRELEGRLLIKFAQGVSAAEVAQIHQKAQAEVISVIPQLNVHVVKAARGNAYLTDKVEYVEPDGLYEATEIPDDEYFDLQWGMTKVRALEAWNITHGNSTVRIAILDTGIDLDHPDLAGKIVASIDLSGSHNPDDVYGHGTHVAGIAAATTNNNLGVAGVGYNSSLMNVKVLNDTGMGSWSGIAQGIVWAADNGANVINMSFGGDLPSSIIEDAVNYAWSWGVLLVASAGNDADALPNYPAYYANCMAVAAVDSTDVIASWSSYGSWVDVAAPGVSIYSAIPDGYGYKSGTSMASPCVAGLAGLVFTTTVDENNDGCINDEVRAKIEYTSVDTAIDVAYGRVDAYEAVTTLSAPPTPPVPIPSMWASDIYFTPPEKKGSLIIQMFIGPFGVEGAQATIQLTSGKRFIGTLIGISEPNGFVYWHVKKLRRCVVTVTSLTHDSFVWDQTKGVISVTYTRRRP